MKIKITYPSHKYAHRLCYAYKFDSIRFWAVQFGVSCASVPSSRDLSSRCPRVSCALRCNGGRVLHAFPVLGWRAECDEITEQAQ